MDIIIGHLGIFVYLFRCILSQITVIFILLLHEKARLLMANILHIDSSPRGDRSLSRTLSGEFIAAWRRAHPQDTVTYRDVGREPVPHLTEAWVEGAYTPPDERSDAAKEAMAVSDMLVDELLGADRLVIAAPMYNFNVPAMLKGWFDQINRVGRTFTSDYQGLVTGKKLLVITVRAGDFRPGTPFAPHDHQEPHLRSLFGFMGVTDQEFVNCEDTGTGDEARERAMTESRARLMELVKSW